MSILGIKDLDRLLFSYLDWLDARNLSCSNKYYYNLFNDRFLYLEFKKQYFEPEGLINRTNYFQIQKHLELINSDSLFFAIKHDIVDLIRLFSATSELLSFHSSTVMEFSPLFLSVQYDSLSCYIHLSKCYELNIKKIFEHAIQCKSGNIIEYMLIEYMLKTNKIETNVSELFISSFYYDCSEFVRLYRTLIDKEEDIFDIVDRLRWSDLEWAETYNQAFHMFLSDISHDDILIMKNKALVYDGYSLIKLLTRYSSPFYDPISS